jgi:hypothetical protein
VTTIRKKDEETKAICERDKIDPQSYLIAERMVSDFYRRAGNQVLAYVRKPKGRERKPTMTNRNGPTRGTARRPGCTRS